MLLWDSTRLAHEAQRVVEALHQLGRHHVVAQRLLGMAHPLGELQHEVALVHPLGDGDEVLDQCHLVAPCAVAAIGAGFRLMLGWRA